MARFLGRACPRRHDAGHIDHDFGWVALGRDEQLRFRAVAVNASLPNADAARDQLLERLSVLAAAPDAEFHQSDSERAPVDFFTPLVPAERLNPTFHVLTSQERYSPARDLIAAMMRFHEDADGNFIEQFQTTASTHGCGNSTFSPPSMN